MAEDDEGASRRNSTVSNGYVANGHARPMYRRGSNMSEFVAFISAFQRS
jgi:hypothetical protein